MLRFLAHRLVHSAVLLLGVSILSFLMADLAPGSFFDEMRLNPQISADTVAHLRSQYGLDQPLAIRYARWVRSALRGEFGFSFAYNSPVGPLLRTRARNTLLLTLTTLVVAWLMALPIGVWSATRKGRLPDRLIAAGSGILLAVPEILLSLGLLCLAVRTGWVKTGGMSSEGFEALSYGGRAADLAQHLFLPVLALTAGQLPVLVRHIRASLIEALNAPLIRTARSYGIPRTRLIYRYALRAAANPMLSLFGLSIATLLSGSFLVEVIMSWPGLGPLFLEAIFNRDLYVVIGTVMWSALFLVLGSLFSDLLLSWNDPRIRVGR